MTRISMKMISAIFLLALCYGLLFPGAWCGEKAESILTQNRIILLNRALEAFRGEYGFYPAGDNGEISGLLQGKNENGKNPKNICFLKFESPGAYNQEGEVVDAWKQPLKFALGRNNMVTIYSFGPNRQDDGGLADDIVVNTAPN